MSTTRRYWPGVRERAVRVVPEHEREHPIQWAAIWSIEEKMRVHCVEEQGETEAGCPSCCAVGTPSLVPLGRPVQYSNEHPPNET